MNVRLLVFLVVFLVLIQCFLFYLLRLHVEDVAGWLAYRLEYQHRELYSQHLDLYDEIQVLQKTLNVSKSYNNISEENG